MRFKGTSTLLALFLFLLLSGCAHVISKDIRETADPSLMLSQVKQNPEIYKGKVVVWGGEIIQTENQRDGTTWIEVYQRPLDWRGEPKETAASEGRFLVLADKYLDPYLFRTGKKITIAGQIQGEKRRPLGETDYQYPFVLSKQIHLWEDYDYPSYYPYYYYDPWWGYPYPWWRSPFRYYRHPR